MTRPDGTDTVSEEILARVEARDNRSWSEVERITERDGSYTGLAVRYLMKNREKLAKDLTAAPGHRYTRYDLIRHLLCELVFPDVAQNMTFDVPQEPRDQRIDERRTHLDRFVDEALAGILRDLSWHYLFARETHSHSFRRELVDPIPLNEIKERGLVFGYETDEIHFLVINDRGGDADKPRSDARSLWNTLHRLGVDFEDREEINLATFLAAIFNGSKKFFRAGGTYNAPAPDSLRKDLGIRIMESLRPDLMERYCGDKRDIDIHDEASNLELIDDLIFDIAQVDRYESRTDDLSNVLPNFSQLERTRDQLLVHMTRLALQGQVSDVMEAVAAHVGDSPLQKFEAASRAGYLRRVWGQKFAPHAAEEVQHLYRLIEAAAARYRAGYAYLNMPTATPEQKAGGRCLIEEALVLAEDLVGIINDVEMVLSGQAIDLGDLAESAALLATSLDGRRVRDMGGQLLEAHRIGAEVADELAGDVLTEQIDAASEKVTLPARGDSRAE